jgi:hypothetical protein
MSRALEQFISQCGGEGINKCLEQGFDFIVLQEVLIRCYFQKRSQQEIKRLNPSDIRQFVARGRDNFFWRLFCVRTQDGLEWIPARLGCKAPLSRTAGTWSALRYRHDLFNAAVKTIPGVALNSLRPFLRLTFRVFERIRSISRKEHSISGSSKRGVSPGSGM